MKYLGCDPGLSGALCIYDSTKNTVDIFSTPTVNVVIAGKKKRRLNYQALTDWLELRRDGIVRAVVEEVWAGKGQGVSSMFAFGEVYGALKMAVAACAIEILLVTPVVWKSRLGLLRQDKNASRTLATKLAPHAADQWRLVGDDGKAEAFLLAYYGAYTK